MQSTSDFYQSREQEIRDTFVGRPGFSDMYERISQDPNIAGSESYVLSNDSDLIEYPLFTNQPITESDIYTSSTQVNSSYYLDVYDEVPTTSSVKLFSVAYGNFYGSGSASTTLMETKAVYSQFKNIFRGRDVTLPGSPTAFSQVFESTEGYKQSGSVFISINKDLVRDKVLDNHLALNLSGSLAYVVATPEVYAKFGQEFVYLSTSNVSNTRSGLLLPSLGIIALSVADFPNFNPAPTAIVANGHVHDIFDSLSTDPLSFQGRSQQKEFIRNLFLRVKFNKFNNTTNVSNNPSGSIQAPLVQGNVWPTTIGLFNAQRTLVGVVKLAQPTIKNSQEELSFKVQIKG